MRSVSSSAWGETSYGFVKTSTKVAAINQSINKIADVYASGTYKALDANGDIVENDLLVDLLNNPNSYQSGQEFRKYWIRVLFSSGYAYVEPTHENPAYLRRLDKGGQSLTILNSDKVKFETTYGWARLKYGNSTFMYGKDNPMDFNEIIPFFDTAQSPNNPLIGISRLESLSCEIENILLSGRAKTNQIKLSGHTIVTPRSRNRAMEFDMGLDAPVDPENPGYTEKVKMEEEFHSGGLAQGKAITISGVELDAFNLMNDIKDIDFGKFKSDDEKTIFNLFGIPPEFHQLDGKGATYENREKAGIEVIDFIAKPLAYNFCNSIREYYDHPNEIIIDYSDSPYYAYANKQKSETNATKVEMYLKLLSNGIISASDLTQILQNEEIIN